ncbi:alpha amylase, catalytic region [Chthoniobacter flavus Ellin428]|uniref:Alpha-1,4-glucan:maltose-1-phosphate maltosyltransferase n=1 Tax=Chthoniobacter flavus Ellin428 TaxID=497964 RepID=B4D8Q9_9BACT|nr:alpha amylase, catalytic region [Chthoniobacter flavus Ellin428]TCO90223.1 starch synthase (maltosyl-transferring) [Chthoniobacter flavus]
MIPRPPSVVIEALSPLVEGGRYPIKRAIGEDIVVETDVFKDGHDIVLAVLKWRKKGHHRWHETPMQCIDPYNKDRWSGVFSVFENAVYEYTIEAWGDYFRSWQHEFQVKFEAGLTELTSEILEGASFVGRAAKLAQDQGQKRDAERLVVLSDKVREGNPETVNALAHSPEMEALMTAYADRSESAEYLLNPPPVAKLIALSAPSAPLENAAAPARKGAGNVIAFPTESSPAGKKGAASKKKKPATVAEPKAAAAPVVAPEPEFHFTPRYPQVYVDRPRANFSQWYEFFPRSAEGRGDKGSTFRDCLPRVDDARAMGFDVIYFPPIHPIGITARKGKNNAVNCQPGEPGVPYAIGNRHQKCPNGGGHKDVAPELGTLEDFGWLVKEIHARGMEVALDFALNCSPDHPYVHEHPDWFYKRPDGTIKYAENPPKKYQDVYPLNYHNADWRTLWDELTSVIEFWCEHGVRIFRVDNPHTKPVAFWEYLIGRVQARFPDALFLSEAFTRPKMMKVLAKAGFTHSYTYFTWRNTKEGLTKYFTEITQTECSEYMRPNLWPNTPDILPSFLQFGGRSAFIIRAVLAATLSPVYGIYSGFELCENLGLDKKPWDAASNVGHFLHLCDNDYKQLAKEEYLDSEKYQWKQRDWNAPGNIKEIITRLNRIRHENRALQQLRNLQFQRTENDLVLYYSKMTAARDNIILVVVSLDPFHFQDAYIDVPVDQFGWVEDQQYQVHDLLNDERYLWTGRRNFVRLHPDKPAHVFRVRRKTHSEKDFDYYL